MRKKSSDSPAVSEKDLAFDKIRETVINERRAGNGIGTLSEKTIHAVLKRYYAVLPEYEEIKCAIFVAIPFFTLMRFVTVIIKFQLLNYSKY